MKTKEFIKQAEKLGFLIENRDNYIAILNDDEEQVLVVYNDYICSIDTVFGAFDCLDNAVKIKLFEMGCEYANTPLEEREEEKKYYVVLKDVEGTFKYVNVTSSTIGRIFIHNRLEEGSNLTQFTKQEIKDYGLQKFADSDLFELIEVK